MPCLDNGIANNLKEYIMSNSIKKDDASNIIRQYIFKHGFGDTTPPLSKHLKADIFKKHYYDKKELIKFCRSIGISYRGSKSDLNTRIEQYLRTGTITVISPRRNSTKSDSETGLYLDKVVENYKSDLITRRFFKENIPDFNGFSALVQKQLKMRLEDGEKLTYKDVIDMHKQFLKDKERAKKSGKPSKVAHDTCQYNQFLIDYSHDTSAKVHDSIEAWNLVRNSAGDKTYQRYKDRINEIRIILKE